MKKFKSIVSDNLGRAEVDKYTFKEYGVCGTGAYAYSRPNRVIWLMLYDIDEMAILTNNELLKISKVLSQELNHLVCPAQALPTLWGNKGGPSINAYKFSVLGD